LVHCQSLGQVSTLLVARGVSYAAGYGAYTAPDSRVPSATAPSDPLAILPSSSDSFLRSEGTHEYTFYSSGGGRMSKKMSGGSRLNRTRGQWYSSVQQSSLDEKPFDCAQGRLRGIQDAGGRFETERGDRDREGRSGLCPYLCLFLRCLANSRISSGLQLQLPCNGDGNRTLFAEVIGSRSTCPPHHNT